MIFTIKTNRLTLRPLEISDAEVLQRIYQTEDILRYFPPTVSPTLETIQRYVMRQKEHWDKYRYGHWGVVPNGQSQVIGWAGLQFLPELNETEVGYLLDKLHWGKGYATEAAQASIQFGFESCALDHIIALVHADNTASRRVIEKCNMSYTETIHIWGIDLMRHNLEHTTTST